MGVGPPQNMRHISALRTLPRHPYSSSKERLFWWDSSHANSTSLAEGYPSRSAPSQYLLHLLSNTHVTVEEGASDYHGTSQSGSADWDDPDTSRPRRGAAWCPRTTAIYSYYDNFASGINISVDVSHMGQHLRWNDVERGSTANVQSKE